MKEKIIKENPKLKIFETIINNSLKNNVIHFTRKGICLNLQYADCPNTELPEKTRLILQKINYEYNNEIIKESNSRADIKIINNNLLKEIDLEREFNYLISKVQNNPIAKNMYNNLKKEKRILKRTNEERQRYSQINYIDPIEMLEADKTKKISFGTYYSKKKLQKPYKRRTNYQIKYSNTSEKYNHKQNNRKHYDHSLDHRKKISKIKLKRKSHSL